MISAPSKTKHENYSIYFYSFLIFDYLQRIDKQGRDEEKKVRWCKKKFFKIEDVFKKILNVRGYIQKIFKNGGVPNLFFPSYDLFFKKKKKTNFLLRKSENCQKVEGCTPPHPVNGTSLVTNIFRTKSKKKTFS